MHSCTITTSHYLAHARVLAESFLAHHPGAGFSILVLEDTPHAQAVGGSHEILTPADVGIDEQELNRRATMYVTQGLAASMKPDLISALLARGHESVLFLDADGCVYGDLAHLGGLAESHSLLLSPHSLDPYPLWKVDSPEQIFLRAGVMNSGLVGAGPGAQPFLQWWAERTARRCIFDERLGLLVDQTWLTIAPALFDHHVLRDRGCNVAGWNLHTRDVEWDGDVPRIDGGPLRYFHFAMSYDPEHPERLTASEHARWWPTLAERPGAARLSREYAQRLIEHGYREVRAAPRLFDTMPGGTPIEPWMRASYREALMDTEEDGTEEPPNPFSHGEESFRRWLEPRTLERVQREPVELSVSAQAGEPGESEDPVSTHELAMAMMETRKLLARIGELERIRDDAVGWAERVSGDLEQAKQAIAERDTLIRVQEAEIDRKLEVMDEIWNSPSWRVTRPLRNVKGLLARKR
jgi:hypothetical protein